MQLSLPRMTSGTALVTSDRKLACYNKRAVATAVVRWTVLHTKGTTGQHAQIEGMNLPRLCLWHADVDIGRHCAHSSSLAHTIVRNIELLQSVRLYGVDSMQMTRSRSARATRGCALPLVEHMNEFVHTDGEDLHIAYTGS